MKSVQLKEIITQIRGISYSKGDAVSNEIRGYIPLIRANNILDGILTKDDLLYVPASIVKDKQLIKTGDIVIAASSGSINIVGKAAYSTDNLNSTFGAFCKLIRPNTKHVLPGYLNFYFQSNAYRKKISSLAQGANINNLKNEHIDELEILLPSLPEQKRIAEILDKADALRQKNKQLLAAYDELLQATFLDMFGDPSSNKYGYDRRTLKEISLRFSDGPFGSNLKTEHYSNEGVQVVRLQNIGINEFVEDDITYVNQKHYENVLKKYSCYPDDIVIATLGIPNIRACVVPKHIKVSVNKADCVLFRVNSHIVNNQYVSHLLNQYGFLSMAKSFMHGQTRTRISSGQLAKISIPIPPMLIQNQFAQIVENIEAQKTLAKQSLQESEDLFNGLVQKAFGGKL